jgi:hypothetical protein
VMPTQSIFLSTLFSVVLGAMAPVTALDTQVPETGAGGAKINIAIINDTEATIRFSLRPRAATWTNYELSAGEKGVYSCVGCGGDFEISVSTAGNIISYNLSASNLYAIRIN